MCLDKVEAAIEDVQLGKMVIVVDEEDFWECWTYLDLNGQMRGIRIRAKLSGYLIEFTQ